MENVIMQSKKINRDKTMRNLWLSLVVILVVSLLVMAIKYIPVKKAQDIIISGILTLTDDYNEYKNNRKEMLEVLERHFDDGFSGITVYDMGDALRKLWGTEEDFADELLEIGGYGNKSAHRW